MRKILLAFLMLAGAVCLKAQNPNVPTISVSVAPSGSCGGSQVRYLTPNGTLYTCQNGTWAVAGGSSSGTGGIYCNATGGATNTLVCTPSPAITSYTAGLNVALKVDANTTGATTLAISGLASPKNIYSAGAPLASGALSVGTGTGNIYNLAYDGTQFNIVSVGPTGPAGVNGSVQALKTANYTVAPTDSGATVPFSGAGLTVSLPASAATLGGTNFMAALMNQSQAQTLAVNLNGATANGQAAYGPIAACGATGGCPRFLVQVAPDGVNYYISQSGAGSAGPTGPTGPSGSNGAIATIQANSVSQTVRGTLNLKSGTNSTVSCVDNSGAASTDCTFASGTGNPTFANAANIGSIVAAYGVNSSANQGRWPGSAQNTGGACTTPNLWPAAGYVRGTTITMAAANTVGTVTRANVSPDCALIVPAPGGAIVPSGAVAGVYADAFSGNFWHLEQNGQLALYWNKQSSTNAGAGVSSIAAEFVADTGYATVLASASASTSTASTTTYNGFFGAANIATTELKAALPMPVAGTLSGFYFCTSTGPPTNTETATLAKNGTPSAMTISVLSTDGATACYVETTPHTVAVVAGDYIDIQWVTGASTVSGIGAYGVVFTPSSGTSSIVGGIINATVTTTSTYSLPISSNVSVTQLNMEMGLPIACSATNLYVTQATANAGGVTTTFTLQKNAVDTAVTGTITSGSTVGSNLLYSGTAVSFAKGDLMTLRYVTGSGTSGSIGGWSITCN